MAKRIALQISMPNHPHIAEVEVLRRLSIACDRLGFEPIEVVTSDDIIRCSPDCVLIQQEVSPKLTDFPTLGLNWSPTDFFTDDPWRRKAVLSLDGHLCGSRQVAEWMDDFCTSHGKPAVIYDGLMLPSTPDAGPARPMPSEPAIMYAGIHWDGSRHGRVFQGLYGRVPMRLYGPPAAWEGHDAYHGALPFDGVSVIEAIRDAGIALCLHKYAHRKANTPSCRLFEAAAAGALIITDDFEFPRYWFRNSVLYVDAELPAELIVQQIVSHVEWARLNPMAANNLAKRSNELFRQHLRLELMLQSLPEFVDKVRQRRSMVVVKGPKEEPQPVVEYIVRIGSRPAETVAQALGSLATQTYREIAVLLVQFHPVPGLDTVVDEFRSRFRWIRHIVVSNNGIRSTAWWAGLNALTADFFGVLDDDDTLFSNHVASLMDRIMASPNCGLVYSGVIKQEDEPGHYVDAPHFSGPAGKVIEERREVFALSEEDFTNFLPTRNVISQNAWICRRSLLGTDVLRDPKMEWAEDVYFLALMAGRTNFAFTAMPTAVWHWRSTTQDNWSLSVSKSTLESSLERWQERLQHIKLPSHNRVPAPNRRNRANELVARDVDKKVSEDLQSGSSKGVEVPQKLNESSMVEFGRCENVTAKSLHSESKAVYLEEDASFSMHRIEQVGIPVVPKQRYTVDVVARPRGRKQLMIEFRDREQTAYARATFDLGRGRVVESTSEDGVAVGPVDKEWVRCQLSLTPMSDEAIFNLTLVDHEGAVVYQGRGQGGIDIRPLIVGRTAQIS